MGEGAMTLVEELEAQATGQDQERGWTREEVGSLPELRDPALLAPFARAYLGASAVTVRDTKSRKVLGGIVSPGEVARLYLKRIMAQDDDLLSKRVPFRRDALQFLDRRPAYYFAGQCAGPFVLVDVVACYATIYTRVCLDLTYRPECDPPLLGLGRGSFPRSSEWIVEKSPRNALWGNLLRPAIREWRHGIPKDDALPNRFFAPDLVGFVLDVVHAIAVAAVERFGALSWAVDGGAFRPDKGRAFVEWLRDEFGLTAEVRAEGPGWLFGATSYQIGPEVTQDVRKGRAHEWQETDSLRRVNVEWLGQAMKERE